MRVPQGARGAKMRALFLPANIHGNHSTNVSDLKALAENFSCADLMRFPHFAPTPSVWDGRFFAFSIAISARKMLF